MARLSRQTKETIKTIAVLLAAALLLFVYMIYPLNRVKAMWGRPDIDSYKLDLTQLPLNDAAAFASAGLTVDTFRVESDGKTSLAGLISSVSDRQPRGTVILIPDEHSQRDSLVGITKQLSDSGFAVVAYDQRASGLSSGKYHGDGQVEAGDLDVVIGYLGVRNQLVAPVVVVGWKLGADAAIFAAHDEKRIGAVVAIEPYLTSRRQVDAYRLNTGTWWFPAYRTIIWFWFNIRSGYGSGFFDTDNIKPVECETALLATSADQSSEAVQKLSQLSGPKLTVQEASKDPSRLVGLVVSLAAK